MKKYYTKIFSQVRKGWSYWCEDKKLALLSSKVSARPFEKFLCNCCGQSFAKSDVAVDHIDAIGPAPETLEELIVAIERLHSKKLQILCSRCHAEKTRLDVWCMKLDAKKIKYERGEITIDQAKNLIRERKNSDKPSRNRSDKKIRRISRRSVLRDRT